VQALTQKLMMYALGRELEYYDMPQVRAVVRAAKAQDYRFSAIVAGIVRSDAFRTQAVAHDPDVGSAQASARAGTSSSRD
jgi:cytochrome c-type biogenesis protein CcmE